MWYYLPEQAQPDTPVLFVMHGVKRDANRYRDEWQPHAQKHGFIIVAPEFSEAAFPGSAGYNYGGTLDDKGRPQPREEWSFGLLEPIFDAVKAAAGNRSARYSIYGHSAGAQFVHRYLCFVPEARVEKAIAANAGWWTLPDLSVEFPYGLHGSVLDEAGLKTMLQRPLVVLLGTADTDPNHPYLRRSTEAMAQGAHRFARGQFFFAAGQKQAEQLGVPFGWKLATAPDVGHVDKDMAPFAVAQLFGPAPLVGRDTAHVRVLFGGDTSHGESYQDGFVKNGETSILVEKGYDHGLVQLGRLLESADLRIINLETPLTTQKESPLKGKDYIHYSDPVKSPAAFNRFGPVVWSLANNHTLDQAVVGLNDTTAALAAAGHQGFGAGMNIDEAARPFVQPCRVGDHSFTLAVFGAFEYRKDYDENFQFYARTDRPGTAPIDVATTRKAIIELKRRIPDAYVVYFVHWGDNYRWKSAEQTEQAHALREAGVDLIIGHGSHAMQEVERDGRGWIFYSLGNFLFNSRGRFALNKTPPYGLPLVVDFSVQNGLLQTGLRVYPIVSDNMVTGYQPRFVSGQELAEIDALLAEKSGWHGAVRDAVRRGADDIGSYLEFGPVPGLK